MITKKYRRLLIGLSFIICHLSFSVALTSCADWDDHYEADKMLLDTQHSTIWQNIEHNGDLSQFASLLKKAGYDEILSASQTYTVWAPVNGSFDYEAMSALSTDRLQREFIENHIARSNYQATGSMNKRICTLNEKVMHFEGSQGYSIEGINVSQANLASGNGIIHTINGKIPFMQNIYESLNNYDYPIDSVSNFYHSYDVRKLNEELSVQGPPVDGKITYLDSIFDKHNDLYQRYNAYINCEDSNYTMIIPTNEAWTKAKEQVSQYFKYLPSFEFMENTATDSEKKLVTINLSDVKYLQDSIVNLMLTGYLFYNNNLYDNKKLNSLKTGEALRCDSLYGTTRAKIFSEDAARLFEGATRVEKSNGVAFITDSLRLFPWTVWNPEIIIEGENTTLQASSVNVASGPQRVNIPSGTQNPEVTGSLSKNSYVEIQPISSSTNPGIVFYLPSVRSTTYSIYLVTVPSNISAPNSDAKPYRFNVSMGYAQENGKNKDADRSWTTESYFYSDSLQIDTIYIGDFTFPVAYAGTGSYYPYLRINSVVTSRDRAKYDRTLRIDCVILRPKELDAYLKEHPDYKYDKGDNR
jgi:uncharacterized surface protein with fasciclin (FAS1) repeats